MYSEQVVFLPYFIKCAQKILFVESCTVRGIDEVKAKNVLPFGQHSDKRTQTRYILLTKQSEELYPLDVCTSKISWKVE